MPLWKHQKEAVAGAMTHTGYMVPHDMGTGKTRTAVEITNRSDTHLGLVICPKTVVPVWEAQFEKHSANKYEFLNLDTGSVKAKAKKLATFIKKHTILKNRMMIVINYDSVWRPPLGIDYDKNNNIVNMGVLLKTEWDIIICDESHRIKAPGSKSSWFITKLGKKAKKRLCLTGTPMPHSPLDAYAQYRFLDNKVFGTSFSRFRKRYALMGGYNDKQVVKFINQEELQEKFFSISHQIVKSEDVLDLPDFMHEQRPCTLSSKAMKIYDKFKKEMSIQLEHGTLTADNALVKLLRLSQIAGGYLPYDEDGSGEVIDNSKTDVLTDILKDLPADEPVAVFSRFTNELGRIKAASKKLGRIPFELSGHMNQLAEWQSGKGVDLAVQIRSGAEGVDFTRARYCIFYSVGYSLGTYLQATKRVHRPGQSRNVFYYHIIAKKTVDELIYKSLREKKKIVDYVLEGIR